VVWSDDGAAADINGGTLKGLLQARDETVPAKLDQLQQLAASLITEVNTRHRAGFGLNDATGLDFFSGSGADDIALAPEIADNPSNIAAASAAASPGDASNALAIAALRHERVMEGGTASIDDFYRSIVVRLGVETRQATDMVDNEEAMLQAMTERRQSVSGVSLDEELANLIKYQHAYAAAARLISVVDEMMQSLLDSTV
jgi:flagellar hook-associated protein 1 FlgK